MKLKLGQQFKFTQNHKIQLAKGGTALINADDKAQVLKKIDDKTAEIIYLTGEAKGLTHIIALEVDDGLDTDAILKKLMDELNS